MFNKFKINYLALLMFSFSGHSSELSSQSKLEWSPAKAASIQKQAQRNQLENNKNIYSVEHIEQARNKLLQAETGEGEIPHSKSFLNQAEKDQQNQLIADLRNQAKLLSKQSDKSIASQAQELFTHIQSKNHSKETKSIALIGNGSAAINAGEVYVFDTNSHRFLQYSKIDPTARIAISESIKSKVDLILIPQAPYRLQVIKGMDFNSTDTIYLQNNSELEINLTDKSGQDVSINAHLRLKIETEYGVFDQDLGFHQELELIEIAQGQNYQLEIVPDSQYASTTLNNISSKQKQVHAKLGAGVEYIVNFTDPDMLVSGCFVGMWVNANKSSDFSTISSENIYNNQNARIGFKLLVPMFEAFDYKVTFWSTSSYCKLEDYSRKLNWVRSDQQSHDLVLKPRPIPNVIYQDENNQNLNYNYGYFYELEDPSNSIYFTSNSKPGLSAGKDYAMNLVDSIENTPSETLFTALAGNFFISAKTETVSPPVIVNISIPTTFSINALIEFYKDGNLVEAFEYSYSREITVQVPPDTYDVRVSGITGEWNNNGDNYLVVMDSFVESKTITSSADQQIDFLIAPAANGVNWTLPVNFPYWSYYHLTIEKQGTPIAARVVGGWYDGIVSNLTELDLLIRADGYHDTRIPVSLSPVFSVVDISTSFANAGRITGTVKDSNGQPLEGLAISMYLEDDVSSFFVGYTDENGAFDIPKVKNGLVYIPSKIEGENLRYYYEIQDPTTSTTLDVILEDVDFHTVSNSIDSQLLYGTGNSVFDVVFLAESYTGLSESFTDSNNNGVWDGALFYDLDSNGLWENNEPYKRFGNVVVDYNNDSGTDISANNEPFVDLNGDGYPSVNDFEVFVQNSKDYIRALLGVPHIKQNVNFDAYILFTNSNQAGNDILDLDETTYLLERETNFGAVYKLNRRLLGLDYTAANDYIDGFFPNNNKLKIVMINQPVTVGRANSFILANGGIGTSSPNSATPGHEFGHNPGGLADEYNEFNGTSLNFFRPKYHMTQRSNPDDIPWLASLPQNFVEAASLPYTFGHGLFAGGNYNTGGVFRPTQHSMMRNSTPRLNDISKTIFINQVCMNNTTAADYFGYPAPLADTIFTESFEAMSGQIVGLCDQ